MTNVKGFKAKSNSYRKQQIPPRREETPGATDYTDFTEPNLDFVESVASIWLRPRAASCFLGLGVFVVRVAEQIPPKTLRHEETPGYGITTGPPGLCEPPRLQRAKTPHSRATPFKMCSETTPRPAPSTEQSSATSAVGGQEPELIEPKR